MLLPLLVYAVVVLGSLSTSSLGLLSVDGVGGGATQWGDSQPIRSDEWLTQAPIELSVLAAGSSTAPALSQDPDLIYQVSSGGIVESLLFHEGNLLRLGEWLPDEMLFAGFRAWPWLLLTLALPPLLRRLGANRAMSWLGLVLVALAPASLWWSFMPVRIMAFAAAGSYVLWLARDRMVAARRPTALLLAGRGRRPARPPGHLLRPVVPDPRRAAGPGHRCRHGRRAPDAARHARDGRGRGRGRRGRPGRHPVGERRRAVRRAQHRLPRPAPRHRRDADRGAAPRRAGLFEMEAVGAPTILNQSEISSGFLVCALWAAVIWPRAWAVATSAQRGAIATLAAATALWSAWAMFAWGPLGEHLPLLSSVLPVRAAQTVGFPAALLLVLLASRLTGATARLATGAAVVCAVATAYGVGDLRRVMPALPTWQVWVAVLGVAAVVYAVTRWPARAWPVAATLALCLLAGADTNPVVHGVGELRTSPAAEAARRLAERAGAEGVVVAANTPAGNALLVANGVPMLTGYQVTGPIEDQWAELDPDLAYEEQWNRGASYLLLFADGPKDAPHGRDDRARRHRGACRRVLARRERPRRRLPRLHRGGGRALRHPGAHLHLERRPAVRLRAQRARLIRSPAGVRRTPTGNRIGSRVGLRVRRPRRPWR